MRTTTRQIVLAVIVGLCGFLGFAVYKFWQRSNEINYDSCLASLTDVIWRQKETRELAEHSNDWKVLSKEEFDLVMQNVRGNDCAGFQDPTLDVWKNKINIAVRKEEPNRWPPI